MSPRAEQKRVLLHVDVRRRDLMCMVWIKHWLEQMGAEVRLCSRVTVRREFERFRPHAAVLAHTTELATTHPQLLDDARRTRLFMLPTEDFTNDLSIYLEPLEPDLKNALQHPEQGWLHYFTRVYGWGPTNKALMLESKLVSPEQALVTGNPRFDLDWDKLFSPSAVGKPIGIVGSLVDINQWDINLRPWPLLHGRTKHPFFLFRQHMDGPQCLFEQVGDLRSARGFYYPADRNAEDVLWASIAHLRLIWDFLDAWTKRGGDVILRPHTMERTQTYDVLVERYKPHLTLNNDPGFFMFLQKVSGVLVMSSTAIIEALLANRPTICLEEMLGGRYTDHVGYPSTRRLPYLDHLWRPQTVDELVELAQKASQGQLAPCPQPEKFTPFFRDNYDWPRREPGTLTIAKDVMQALSGDPLEPPAVTPWQQLKNEADYRTYMLARQARQIVMPEHRILDRVTHHLSLSRQEEAQMVQYLRQA